jgi:predicted permease
VFPRWKEIANLRESWDKGWLSHEQFELWRENTTLFSAVAIHSPGGAVLTGAGRPRYIERGRGSASLLSVLGVSPAQGRWFTQEEEGIDQRSPHPVVVLSHEFWVNSLGGDQDAIGRFLMLSEVNHTVIGILPPGFRVRGLTTMGDEVDIGQRDIWTPAPKDGGYHWEALGRLAPGVSIEQATAEMQSILLADVDPASRYFHLLSRRQAENHGLTTPLTLLLCATGVLLIIACGNVATLLLGEIQNRRAEIAARMALGAGRGRIIRQLLTESFILSALGSGLGIALAWAGTPAIVSLGPSIPWMDQMGVDMRVMGVAIAMGTVSALAFGALPAYVALRDSGSIRHQMGVRGGSRGSRLSSVVVGAEVALTSVLLVSAVLLAGSLLRLLEVDPGFRPERLATISIRPPDPDGPEGPEAARSFTQDVVDELSKTAGVVEATFSRSVPFVAPPGSFIAQSEDAPGRAGSWSNTGGASALGWWVAPSFTAVMGMYLLAGRGLTDADIAEEARTALVSESLAGILWPGESPLGARFRYSESEDPLTVVGVVRDIKHKGLGYQVEPSFYLAEGSDLGPGLFVVRTSGDPAHLLEELKSAVWAVDPDILIGQAGTLDSYMSDAVSDDRYRALLAAAMACAAALLAAIGVFGVTARAVAQRRQEFGVRMALGAADGRLIGEVVRWSLLPGVVGAGVGLLAAFWASRLIAGFLFGIEPTDPASFAGVTAGVLLTCLLASYFPARRIAQVDPVEVLREE